MLKLFQIKDLHGSPSSEHMDDAHGINDVARRLPVSQNRPSLVRLSHSDYDEIATSHPRARLTYMDDDDGELITVGSSLELSQRLDEPITVPAETITPDPVHIFDIRRSNSVTELWKRFEYNPQPQHTQEPAANSTASIVTDAPQSGVQGGSDTNQPAPNNAANNEPETLMAAFEAEMARILSASDSLGDHQANAVPPPQPTGTRASGPPNLQGIFIDIVQRLTEEAEAVRSGVTSRIPELERQIQNAQRALPGQVGSSLQAALANLNLEEQARNVMNSLNNASLATGQRGADIFQGQLPPLTDMLRGICSDIGGLGQEVFDRLESELGYHLPCQRQARRENNGQSTTHEARQDVPMNEAPTDGSAPTQVNQQSQANANVEMGEAEPLATNEKQPSSEHQEAVNGLHSTSSNNVGPGSSMESLNCPIDSPPTSASNQDQSGLPRFYSGHGPKPEPMHPYDLTLPKYWSPPSFLRSHDEDDNSMLALRSLSLDVPGRPFNYPSSHCKLSKPLSNPYYVRQASLLDSTPSSPSRYQSREFRIPRDTDSTPRQRDNSTHATKPQKDDAHVHPIPPSPGQTLFIGNVGYGVNAEMIGRVVASKGFLVTVELPHDSHTGTHPGFGYLNFSSVQAARAALEALQGTHIAGLAINLEFVDHPSISSPNTTQPDSKLPGRGPSDKQTVNGTRAMPNDGKKSAPLTVADLCSGDDSTLEAGLPLIDGSMVDSAQTHTKRLNSLYPSLLPGDGRSDRLTPGTVSLPSLSQALNMEFPPVSQQDANRLANRLTAQRREKDQHPATSATVPVTSLLQEGSQGHVAGRDSNSLYGLPGAFPQDASDNERSGPSSSSRPRHGREQAGHDHLASHGSPCSRRAYTMRDPSRRHSSLRPGEAAERPLRRHATEHARPHRTGPYMGRGMPMQIPMRGARPPPHTRPVSSQPQPQPDPRERRVDECVSTLISFGYGSERDGGPQRMRVYAAAADGKVDEAIEMIEEERKAYEQQGSTIS